MPITTLSYPQHKLHLKNNTEDFLYAPVYKQFKKQLDTLIIKNTARRSYSHKSFVYKNLCYSCEPNLTTNMQNRLAVTLHPEMQEYLTNIAYLENSEKQHVMGFIRQVLNLSADPKDYIRLLPDALHHLITNSFITNPKRLLLSELEINRVLEKHKKAISMIKARLVMNLII